MGVTIKIHNTDIERELTNPTELWFYEFSLKEAEKSGKVLRAKLSEDGTIYYTIGELNVRKLVEVALRYIK
ncbi:hypothetical protein ACIQGW_16025 [Lysinibacillus xylanilyticus]|uniref:hypothetical protein n=1 Tax=Lysinibacillus xylanilyticus TaxID=582475 RepID=UPI0038225937